MSDGHEPEEQIERPPPGRRGLPAARTLVVILVTLLVWSLLYAPELKRSAETHPVGTRRSVSLAILTPLAWLSDTIGLSVLTDAAARAAGRDPDGPIGGDIDDDSDVETLPPPPSTSVSPKPPKPPPLQDTVIREPTTDRKLRVVVVGDSLAQGIGYFAERVFKPYFVNVIRQGRISTGLARPDYFNWQAEMETIAERFRPDLTIVLLGENDNQALLYPNVAYVDTWDLFAKADGDYTAYYRDGTGRVRLIRADDGLHFNADGYTILMREIAKAARREFKLHPKTF